MSVKLNNLAGKKNISHLLDIFKSPLNIFIQIILPVIQTHTQFQYF